MGVYVLESIHMYQIDSFSLGRDLASKLNVRPISATIELHNLWVITLVTHITRTHSEINNINGLEKDDHLDINYTR